MRARHTANRMSNHLFMFSSNRKTQLCDASVSDGRLGGSSAITRPLLFTYVACPEVSSVKKEPLTGRLPTCFGGSLLSPIDLIAVTPERHVG